jgi:serine/threonine protein kinase
VSSVPRPGRSEDSGGGWSAELERTWTFALQGIEDPHISVRPDAITMVHGGAQTQTLAAAKTHGTEDSHYRTHQVSDFDDPLERPELEIIGEIGTGGMGSVFRAWQNSLGRELAIKRLRTDIEAAGARDQFENEARVTAFLDHPNIVPVHDFGADQQGRIFYSMKLIKGTPWSRILAARRAGSAGPGADGLDLRDHLEILLEVCNAAAFAHSRGILHRDIKADNVMVGDYGEVLLVDWGLGVAVDSARAPRGVADLSKVGVQAGTPTHMAPETARGERARVGTWTDGYQLAAVLFDLLYGRPPHGADTALEAVKVAARNDWHFPEQVPPDLRPYHEVLRPVLERGLATDTELRFADAKAFATELRTALRNLDAARLADSAFAELEALRASAPAGPHERYRRLARIIGTLEKSLGSWPENPDARAWLAGAHLDHAEISLAAGDLVSAGSHFDELARLPGTGSFPTALLRRSAQLRKSLANALRAERRGRIRSRGLQVAAAGSLGGLVALGVVSYSLVDDAHDQVTAERNHLSRLLIRTAADGIDSELHGMFDPVRGGLHTAARWARDGLLDGDDPEGLTPLFLPLLEGIPVISLITRADSAGREYMIMRTDDGWRVRVTNPGAPTVWHRYLSSGMLVETYTEDLDYDPLTRPWYEGADELRDGGREGEIFWTAPYVFYTGKQPGVTASIPVTSSSGREFVIGFDILLSEISEFTVRVPDARHGKVFVLSEDDRVIGLPRAPRFTTAEGRKEAILRPLAELGDAVSAGALVSWDEQGRPVHEPLRFFADEQYWWAGFRSFDLAERRRFWIGVVLPESDFNLEAP